jgi:hypothetical protein
LKTFFKQYDLENQMEEVQLAIIKKCRIGELAIKEENLMEQIEGKRKKKFYGGESQESNGSKKETKTLDPYTTQ